VAGLEPDAACAAVACSLDGAGMTERLARLRAIGAASLVATERLNHRRALLRFRPDGDARASLEEVVAAERACCPFLDLRLADGAAGLIELSIAAPEEGVPIMEELVAAFAGAAR
jgi:hypothetical protein